MRKILGLLILIVLAIIFLVWLLVSGGNEGLKQVGEEIKQVSDGVKQLGGASAVNFDVDELVRLFKNFD